MIKKIRYRLVWNRSGLEMTQKYVGKSHAEDIRRKCAVIHF